MSDEMSEFLPVTREEMETRGWEQPDFVYISGDAYVDHPSLEPPLLQEPWRHMVIRCVYLHSLTGKMLRNSDDLENPVRIFNFVRKY